MNGLCSSNSSEVSDGASGILPVAAAEVLSVGQGGWSAVAIASRTLGAVWCQVYDKLLTEGVSQTEAPLPCEMTKQVRSFMLKSITTDSTIKFIHVQVFFLSQAKSRIGNALVSSNIRLMQVDITDK